MTSKQRSWRGSKQALSLLISLLSLSSFLIAMEDRSKPWQEQPDEVLQSMQIGGCTYLAMKQVYETAPETIKGTVAHLIDKDHYKPNGAPGNRFLMLHGPSGSGKTTLAYAIAAYANWDVEYTTPADFQRGTRSEAAQNLRNKAKELEERNVPILWIIDEVNGLLEHTESKNHDTAETSKEFWTIMDSLYGKHNMYVVGLANRLYKIPKQIKTRIKAHNCRIDLPQDVDGRLGIFKNILRRETLGLTPESEVAMKKLLTTHPDWAGRDYAALCDEIIRRAADEWKLSLKKGDTIPVKLLLESVKAMLQSEEDLVYDYEEMSDADRQEFHQAQNMLQTMIGQVKQKMSLIPGRAPGMHAADGKQALELIWTSLQKHLVKQKLDLKAIMDFIGQPYEEGK